MAIETIRATSGSASHTGSGAGDGGVIAQAYDNNTLTSDDIVASAYGKTNSIETVVYSGFTKSSTWNGYVVKTLIQGFSVSQATESNGGTLSITCSIDGGSTYPYILMSANLAAGDSTSKYEVSTTLTGNIDASLIRIKAVSTSRGTAYTDGLGSNVTLSVFEVWVDGTVASIPVTLTAGSGNVVTLVKQLPIVRVASMGASAVIARVGGYLRSIAGSVAQAATIVRQIRDNTFSAAVATTSTISRILAYVRGLTAVPVASSSLTFLRAKALSASSALTALIVRQRGRVMTATATTMTATMARVRLVTLAVRAWANTAQNLVKWSQDLDAIDWAKISTTVTANAASAPDGSTTADLLVSSATFGQAYIDLPSTAGAIYTGSVYAKAGALSQFQFYLENIGVSGGQYIRYNVSTGAMIGTGATGSGTTLLGNSITPVGNGWWRVVLTMQTNSATTLRIHIGDMENGGGTNGIYLWGVQIESGSTASAYTPTTGAAITAGPAVVRAIAWTKLAALTIFPALTKGFVRTLTSVAQGSVATLTKAGAQIRTLSAGVGTQVLMVRNLSRRMTTAASMVPSIKGMVGKVLVYQATLTLKLIRVITVPLFDLVPLTATVINSTPRVLYASASTAASMVRSILYTLQPPAVQTLEWIGLAISKTIAASTNVGSVLLRGFMRSFTTEQASAASVTTAKRAVRAVTAFAATTATKLISVWKTIGTVSYATGLLVPFSRKILTLAASSFVTPSITRRLSILIQAAVAPAAVLIRRVQKIITGIPATTATILRALPATLTTVQTVTAILWRGTVKVLAAALGKTATMIRTPTRTLAVVSISTATMIRRFTFALIAQVVTNEQISRELTRTLATNVGAYAVLTFGKLKTVTMSALSTTAATLAKPATKLAALVKAVTVTPSISKASAFARALTVGVVLWGRLALTHPRALAAVQPLAAVLGRVLLFARGLTATVGKAATMARQIGDTLTAAVTATATIRKAVGKVLFVSLAVLVTLAKGLTRTLSAAAGIVATLLRAPALFINRRYYLLGASLRRYLKG